MQFNDIPRTKEDILYYIVLKGLFVSYTGMSYGHVRLRGNFVLRYNESSPQSYNGPQSFFVTSLFKFSMLVPMDK